MSHPEYDGFGDPADKLLEELHEVGVEVCKGKRFGWLSAHPERPELTNFAALAQEMSDLNKRWDELQKHLHDLAFRGELR